MQRDTRSRLSQIRAVFDETGLGRHVAAIRADEGRRVTTSRAPDSVVTAAEFKRARGSDNALAPIEGSIMMFWARPGSDTIPRLAKAYESGDRSTLHEVDEIMTRQMADEPIPTLDALAA